MARKEFASSLAAGTPRSAGWATLIVSLLPVFMEMPCFAEKGPEQQKRWLERHPVLARRYIVGEIRKKDPTKSRKQAVAMANKALASIKQQTLEEFSSINTI